MSLLPALRAIALSDATMTQNLKYKHKLLRSDCVRVGSILYISHSLVIAMAFCHVSFNSSSSSTAPITNRNKANAIGCMHLVCIHSQHHLHYFNFTRRSDRKCWGKRQHRNAGTQNAIHVALDARNLYICKICINKSIYCVRFAQQCHIISLLRGGRKEIWHIWNDIQIQWPRAQREKREKNPTAEREREREWKSTTRRKMPANSYAWRV